MPRKKITPVPDVPSDPLDLLLRSMECATRENARDTLERINLLDPQKAYNYLTVMKRLPEGMDFAAFAPLFSRIMA